MDAAQLHAIIKKGSSSALAHALSVIASSSSKKQKEPPINILHQGTTALHVAVSTGKAELISLLLEARAQVDIRDQESNWTALHRAIYKRHIYAAKLLMDAGASIDAKDREGLSPVDLMTRDLQDLAQLSQSGICYAWGRGHNYQLGQTNATRHTTKNPTRVEEMCSEVSKVATSKLHSAILQADGKLFTSGCGLGGRLGHGDETSLAHFKRVEGDLTNIIVTSVSLSDDHSVLVADYGGAYTWGSNSHGQLGLGIPLAEWSSTPRRVADLKKHKLIACTAGQFHTAFIEQGGHLWTCGNNADGQLGHSILGSTSYASPKRVEFLSGCSVAIVSGGALHTVVSSKDFPGTLMYVGFGKHTPTKVPLPPASQSAMFDKSLCVVCDLSTSADVTWAAVSSGALYVIEHPSSAGTSVNMRALIPKCARRKEIVRVSAAQRGRRAAAISRTGQLFEIVVAEGCTRTGNADRVLAKSNSFGSSDNKCISAGTPDKQPSAFALSSRSRSGSGASPSEKGIAVPASSVSCSPGGSGMHYPHSPADRAASSSFKEDTFLSSSFKSSSLCKEEVSPKNPSPSPSSWGSASPFSSYTVVRKTGEADIFSEKYAMTPVKGLRRVVDVAFGHHHAMAVVGILRPPTGSACAADDGGKGPASLVSLCERAIQQHMDLGNAAFFADFAETNAMDTMRAYSLDLLMCNLDVTMAAGLWKDLSERTCASLERRLNARFERRSNNERRAADMARKASESAAAAEAAEAAQGARPWRIVDGEMVFDAGGGFRDVRVNRKERNEEDEEEGEAASGAAGGRQGLFEQEFADRDLDDQFFLEMDGEASQDERGSRERKARKKLSQICALEALAKQGVMLDRAQQDKIERKTRVMHELWEIGLDAHEVYKQVEAMTWQAYTSRETRVGSALAAAGVDVEGTPTSVECSGKPTSVETSLRHQIPYLRSQSPTSVECSGKPEEDRDDQVGVQAEETWQADMDGSFQTDNDGSLLSCLPMEDESGGAEKEGVLQGKAVLEDVDEEDGFFLRQDGVGGKKKGKKARNKKSTVDASAPSQSASGQLDLAAWTAVPPSTPTDKFFVFPEASPGSGTKKGWNLASPSPDLKPAGSLRELLEMEGTAAAASKARGDSTVRKAHFTAHSKSGVPPSSSPIPVPSTTKPWGGVASSPAQHATATSLRGIFESEQQQQRNQRASSGFTGSSPKDVTASPSAGVGGAVSLMDFCVKSGGKRSKKGQVWVEGEAAGVASSTPNAPWNRTQARSAPSPSLEAQPISLANIQAEEERNRDPRVKRRTPQQQGVWINQQDVVAMSLDEIQRKEDEMRRKEHHAAEEAEALALIKAYEKMEKKMERHMKKAAAAGSALRTTPKACC